MSSYKPELTRRPEGYRPPKERRPNKEFRHPHGAVKSPPGWGYFDAMKKLYQLYPEEK